MEFVAKYITSKTTAQKCLSHQTMRTVSARPQAAMQQAQHYNTKMRGPAKLYNASHEAHKVRRPSVWSSLLVHALDLLGLDCQWHEAAEGMSKLDRSAATALDSLHCTVSEELAVAHPHCPSVRGSMSTTAT
mmetsp:Transcript_113211/g.330900  ORF Transcript_113211/g.330900 Transcript_113211/m.330900 type:complete len:132 (+) Transcript_113211:267-662(+)